MSTSDPRTEVVFEKMTVDEIITGLIGVVLLNGNTGPYRRAIHSALTTEAARVRGEERNMVCRQLVQRADELDASADAAIQQGDLSAPSDEQHYAAQQFKAMAKHLRVEAMKYRPDTPKPKWSTARPTVAGGSTND